MKQNNTQAPATQRAVSKASTVRSRPDTTPRQWGAWLTGGLHGFGRQMLNALQGPRGRGHYDGNMYEGTVPASTVARRRAKAKAGRRQRVHQSMAKRGKR